MRISTEKISNTEYKVRPTSKRFIGIISFVNLDEEENNWIVDFNYDNEYDNKEDAIRAAKSIVTLEWETKAGLL
jgi:hypothetical protein